MQKTIKINPELFTVGKQGRPKTKNNKSQKNTGNVENIPRNNKIRQKLLDKIKNFQKNNQHLAMDNSNTRQGSKLDHVSKPSNDISNFDDSLTFLDNLSQNYHAQQQNRAKNHTFKNKNGEITTAHEVSNQVPDELLAQPYYNNPVNPDKSTLDKGYKSYGCLKNGSLPTFREWKRMTQKNRVDPSSQLESSKMRLKIDTDNNEYYENRPISTQVAERQQRLHDIKNQFNKQQPVKQEQPVKQPVKQEEPVKQEQLQQPVKQELQPVKQELQQLSLKQPEQLQPVKPIDKIEEPTTQMDAATPIQDDILQEIEVYNIPKILRKTKTLKFKLGRNRKNRNIGIYIKNRETLKNIKHDFKRLQEVDIGEVKKYLRRHNLIASGSSSPNDVLREIYEKAILAGDVTNKNTTNLLTNFMSEQDEE